VGRQHGCKQTPQSGRPASCGRKLPAHHIPRANLANALFVICTRRLQRSTFLAYALSKLSVTGEVASNPLIFRRSTCGVIVPTHGDLVVIFGLIAGAQLAQKGDDLRRANAHGYVSGGDGIDSAERRKCEPLFAFADDRSRTCGTTAHLGNRLFLMWRAANLDRLTR
jgi:hypothetical protein